MGRLYPVGRGASQTIARPGRPAVAPAPPLEMPSYKPTPIGIGEWPVPPPDNDNNPPGRPKPPKRGMRMPKPIRPMLPGWGISALDAVGVVPGFSTPPVPAVWLSPGGRWAVCPNPSGFGGPFSSITYLPGSLQINMNACISLQALPGGNDGYPNPAVDPRNMGAWRYTNTAQTRYSHLWSIKDGKRGWMAEPLLPALRQASAGSPKPPPLPAPPKKDKEQKFIMQGRFWQMVNLATEAGDVADCMFSALPGQTKARTYGEYGGRLGKWAKAQTAYDNWGSINWTKVASCMYANALEDAAYGRLGRFTGRANRRRGNLAGLGVGPAL